MYTDTMFKEHPSACGNTCFQIFVTAEGFVTGEPMKSKSDAYLALDHVCRNYGVPKLLVSDNAKEESLGNWGRITKQYLIKQRMTEPHSGWQNRCEDEIREIRKYLARMSVHQCPDTFWDIGLSYVQTVRQFIVRNAANNRSPIETITGDIPDITEIMDFDFYQWIMYRDQLDKDVPVKMGQWLGIAHDAGFALTYWILKPNCQIIARSTVRPLLADEIKDETGKQMRLAFTNAMNNQYKDFDHDLDDLE